MTFDKIDRHAEHHRQALLVESGWQYAMWGHYWVWKKGTYMAMTVKGAIEIETARQSMLDMGRKDIE